MPFEGVDLERGPGVAFQRLGRAERTDRRRQIVMPWAGIGVVFRIGEQMVGQELQPRLVAKNRDTINPAARHRNMFFEPPAQPAKEIKLAIKVVVSTVLSGQRVISRLVHMGVFDADRVGVLP